jgi:hypothetical protein
MDESELGNVIVLLTRAAGIAEIPCGEKLLGELFRLARLDPERFTKLVTGDRGFLTKLDIEIDTIEEGARRKNQARGGRGRRRRGA